jgi:hypothetical protein
VAASCAARISRSSRFAAPYTNLLKHVTHADSRHPPGALLHRESVLLAGVAVRVDKHIVKVAVRAGASRVRVPDKRDYRPAQRGAHVQRSGARRQHERTPVKDSD